MVVGPEVASVVHEIPISQCPNDPARSHLSEHNLKLRVLLKHATPDEMAEDIMSKEHMLRQEHTICTGRMRNIRKVDRHIRGRGKTRVAIDNHIQILKRLPDRLKDGRIQWHSRIK